MKLASFTVIHITLQEKLKSTAKRIKIKENIAMSIAVKAQ